ncbi:MAG: hypothetical protein EOP85_08410 [Verrucomicrobiaceae bacterium]|nr:MAG: hypothetical protein EOP85_08410 [Verrucomicrobiaceae bacterium]
MPIEDIWCASKFTDSNPTLRRAAGFYRTTMNRQAQTLVTQSVRFLFFPFPFAIQVCFWMLSCVDTYNGVGHNPAMRAEPGEMIGGVLVTAMTVIFQLAVGIPSLRVLDRREGNSWTFLKAGAGIALLFSLMLAFVLHSPEAGESYGWMLLMVLIFFGLPLLAGYWIAGRLRLAVFQTPAA